MLGAAVFSLLVRAPASHAGDRGSLGAGRVGPVTFGASDPDGSEV